MSLKVLVVDDDDVILFLHNMLLEDNGMSSDSVSFENGRDALDYLNAESTNEQSYLILLDINMPVMNGWELLDSLQHLPHVNKVSVAMVTSSIDSEDREKASNYPQVIGYFEKPLNEKALSQIRQYPKISVLLEES